MKKVIFFALIAIAAITLASYSTRRVSSIKEPQHAIKFNKFAGAQSFNEQYTYDLSGQYLYDDCTGEYIVLSGSEHYLIHGVYDPKTGVLKNETFHINLQGAGGVGELSGNKYQFVGGVNERESYSGDGCSVTSTQVETVNITTAGSGNNFYEKIRIKYTYNFCTGNFSVTRDVFEYGCK